MRAGPAAGVKAAPRQRFWGDVVTACTRTTLPTSRLLVSEVTTKLHHVVSLVIGCNSFSFHVIRTFMRMSLSSGVQASAF